MHPIKSPKKLIEVEAIDAKELKEIIEATSPGPSIVPGTGDLPSRPANTESDARTPDAGQAEAGG